MTAIGHDVRKTALLEAMLLLAGKLDLKVVAEGVEEPRQVAFLAQRGCEYLQGYLLCRPVSADELSVTLQEWSVSSLRWRSEDRGDVLAG